MANVPIVTEVTKAQLDALVAANGLNEGLQYKVTDKEWLLIASANNKLFTFMDNIIISHTEIMPDYIISKRITIDTGVIDVDISELTGTPLVVENMPEGYIPEKCYMKVLSLAGEDHLGDVNVMQWFIQFTDFFGIGVYDILANSINQLCIPMQSNQNTIMIKYNGNGNSCRFYIQFNKIEV